MTEATKPKAPALPPVRLVDEAYEPPKENATPIELRNGEIAAAKREGRAKEKAIQAAAFANMVARYQGEIEGVKQAHQEELTRIGNVERRVGHRVGIVHGAAGATIALCAVVLGTWLMLKDVVILNTATQRVNYPEVPALLDRPPTTDAPRSESAP